MSLWQTKAVGLGVTPNQWSLTWRNDKTGALASQVFAPSQMDGLLAPRNGLRRYLRCPLRVTVADELTRCWTITAPAGMASLRELRQFAALRFEHLFGEPSNQWEIEADWHAYAPTICRAIPRDLSQAFKAWSVQSQFALVDWTSVGLRLKMRCDAKAKLPDFNGVWVSIGVEHAYVVWCGAGHAKRVALLRINPHDPWVRLGQEFRRIAAQEVAASAKEVRWTSLVDIAEPLGSEFHYTRCVWGSESALGLALDDALEHAVLLASLGVK